MDNQEPSKLAQENAQARAANLSYGKWKALQQRQETKPEEPINVGKVCQCCGKPIKGTKRKQFCDPHCQRLSYEARNKEKRAEYNRKYKKKRPKKEKEILPEVLSGLDKDVILALAEKNMNRSSAARFLNVSGKCIENREERIKRITGLDPCNFYDLHELVNMVKKEG